MNQEKAEEINFDELVWKSINAKNTLYYSNMKYGKLNSKEDNKKTLDQENKIIKDCTEDYEKLYMQLCKSEMREELVKTIRSHIKKALLSDCPELASTAHACLQITLQDNQEIPLKHFDFQAKYELEPQNIDK